MATTIAELSKKTAGLSREDFAAAHPWTALAFLFSAGSRVDSSLTGDLPEDGLLVTDIFFFRRDAALGETEVGDPWHPGSFSVQPGSPVLFLDAAGEAPEIKVGRSEGSHIFLPYATVSAAHASFVKRGDAWAMLPEDTTNGTFVNEEKVEHGVTCLVGDRAVIAFGPEVRAQFLSPTALHAVIASVVTPVRDERR